MDNRLSNVKKAHRSPKPKQNCFSVKSELEQFAEASNDAIRIINKDFTIRYINRAFAEMTDVNQIDVVGKKCWDVFPSPVCQTSECRANRVLNGEKRIEVEIERPKHDSKTIPCVVTTSPLKDNTGNITGIVEQFRDITEIRHKEKEVKESEDRYRALIELGAEAGEAVVMLQDIDNREGIQTFVSDQWPRITGYSKKELLGTCFFDLVSENDRQDSIERHRKKISGEAVPGMFDMNIIRKDGTKVPVELTGAFTTYQDKRANVVYLREITERKQFERKIQESEELYHALFQNVPIAIIEYDFSQVKLYYEKLRANGITDFRKYYFVTAPDELRNCKARLQRINNQALSLWKASGAEDIDFALGRRSKHPKSYDGLRECQVGLAEGKTYFDYEDSFQTIEGDWRHFHTWVSVAPGCENSLSKVYVCFVDISARKKAEKELKLYQDNLQNIINERTSRLNETNEALRQEINKRTQAEENLQGLLQQEHKTRHDLEEQIRTRMEFTRALVHELKTPLTPMVAASEAIMAGVQEEPWKSLATRVNRGANNLSIRINELLDIAKGEVGILTISCKSVKTITLLRELYDTCSQEASQSGITLVLDIPKHIPSIWADRERLRQIVLNLLDNAIKFTPKGGKITLSARVEGQALIVSVQDTGIGMTSLEQRRLFKPYERVSGSRKSLRGLGLGLSLSKTLIELHGGQIWLKSKKGGGSTFSFSIPMHMRILKSKG